jgi:peptide/nickel transport system substrate-binding protein
VRDWEQIELRHGFADRGFSCASIRSFFTPYVGAEYESRPRPNTPMKSPAIAGEFAMKWLIWLSLAALVLAACAGPANESRAVSAQPGRATEHALVMAIRYEPPDLAPKMTSQSGTLSWKVPFNASLAHINSRGEPDPYLAESLPQLGTNSWQVFPDGRMETVHRLRPNLTWHDGHALTAEDFVFAWTVYRTPGLSVFSSEPQNLMDEVIAPDPQTLVIRWNALYYDASALTDARDGSLEPLPRHLLDQRFADALRDPAAQDTFLNLPHWTSAYVGAGPYRLEQWDHGVQLTGVAFDGHALGRPKISRLTMRIFADENTVLSNMLAGTIDIATRFTLRFEHGLVLKRRWDADGRGRVIMSGGDGTPVSLHIQLRPEYLQTRELLDLRVRRALAHAMDKSGVLDGLYEGEGEIPDTFLPRNEPFYAEVDRTIVKYAADPKRAEQLLTEAGFAKGRDGYLVNQIGERFSFDFRSTANLLTQRAMTIVANSYQQIGIDAQLSVLPAVLDTDRQVRHTFPGIATFGSSGPLHYLGSEIGSVQNRWAGQNRGGWANPEYDRLWNTYTISLDRTDRNRSMIGMAKLVSDDVPGLFVYYSNSPIFAHKSALEGPDRGAKGTENFWNIYEWVLRS